jgi:hypothetical protein
MGYVDWLAFVDWFDVFVLVVFGITGFGGFCDFVIVSSPFVDVSL